MIKKKAFLPILILLLVALPAVCFAADDVIQGLLPAADDVILKAGTGLGGEFDEKFINITQGIVRAMHVVLIIMTAVAGLMIAWGMEEGKKLMWQTIFGIGLAFNFGSFMMDLGFWEMANQSVAQGTVQQFELHLNPSAKFEIFQQFLNNYINHVINPGAKFITSPCLKMLVVLAVVQSSWDLSFNFLSGDKVQYMLSMVVKTGFWMYLISNWIPLMNALASGFEHIGLSAGGNPDATVQPDKIVMNAIDIFTTEWGKLKGLDLIYAPGEALISIFALIVITICLFFTSLELFMGKVEFYTIALISLPLLPFAITNKFSFLADKVIGAMFNLAIKLALISFLSTIATPLFASLVQEVSNHSALAIGEHFKILLQAVITALMVFLLTWKTPELVTSLLSGQPQLGGSMQQMVSKTATAAAAAAGQITHAVKSRGASGGGVKGTLTQLGKQKLADTSFFKAYAGANRNMEDFWGNAPNSKNNNKNPFRSYQPKANDSDSSQTTNSNKAANTGNKATNNGIKNSKKH